MNTIALTTNPASDYRAAMQQAAVAYLYRHRCEHLAGDSQLLENCTRYLTQSLEVPRTWCSASLNWPWPNSKA